MVRQERIIILSKEKIDDEYVITLGLPDGDSAQIKVSKEAFDRTMVGGKTR